MATTTRLPSETDLLIGRATSVSLATLEQAPSMRSHQPYGERLAETSFRIRVLLQRGYVSYAIICVGPWVRGL
jgi:hypothetical protein